jgi:hypothetical protein
MAPGVDRGSALGRYAGGFDERTPCYAPFLHMFIAWARILSIILARAL